MAGFRATGMKGGVLGELLAPGDIMLGGESATAGALTTVGNGTWLGSMIASGIIQRTGPVANYTDTTDSAANIVTALAGNNPAAEVQPGTSFRLLFVNYVAFTTAWVAGAGAVTGAGTFTLAASSWREYLVTVLNASPAAQLACATTNANPSVTFVLPSGMQAFPIGSAPTALNITPGMSVSGAGISAGTTVLGVTQGQGGIVGVTLSANATATAASVALTFTPTVKFDGLRSGTL
jgi:hypothetical protein